jgi:hypothetical protein
MMLTGYAIINDDGRGTGKWEVTIKKNGKI